MNEARSMPLRKGGEINIKKSKGVGCGAQGYFRQFMRRRWLTFRHAVFLRVCLTVLTQSCDLDWEKENVFIAVPLPEINGYIPSTRKHNNFFRIRMRVIWKSTCFPFAIFCLRGLNVNGNAPSVSVLYWRERSRAISVNVIVIGTFVFTPFSLWCPHVKVRVCVCVLFIFLAAQPLSCNRITRTSVRLRRTNLAGEVEAALHLLVPSH